jgi:hypothetical protein
MRPGKRELLGPESVGSTQHRSAQSVRCIAVDILLNSTGLGADETAWLTFAPCCTRG